jgi:hypothetical protein
VLVSLSIYCYKRDIGYQEKNGHMKVQALKREREIGHMKVQEKKEEKNKR